MNELTFLEKTLQSLKNLAIDILVIIFILVLARIILNIASKFTSRAMKKAENLEDKEITKQIKTQMTLTHSANRYVVYIIVLFLIFKQIGLGDEISGAIIAAGVGGLIISLGLQSIVKDIVAGIFLMFEKQFFVGDYVKINDYEGTVISTALRVVYLNCSGKKVIIPNGDIRDVVNYTRNNAIAFITIPTCYKDNTREIMAIMQEVVDKYYQENKDILTEIKPEVLGISNFNTNSVDIMIKIDTQPLKHWKVEKEIKLLIKEEFDRKQISFPTQQIIVKND